MLMHLPAASCLKLELNCAGQLADVPGPPCRVALCLQARAPCASRCVDVLACVLADLLVVSHTRPELQSRKQMKCWNIAGKQQVSGF